MNEMTYRQLGQTDLRLSAIGFGAAPLGGEYGALDLAEAERAVHKAIDEGITFFDTAPYYGRTVSEERLGKMLEGRRDRVVLATKIGRYDKASFDFSAERVRSSVDESLRRLRTDHVDLITAHDIEFGDREQVVNETIPALREIQRTGKVRYVGISGLPLRILADVAVRAQVDSVLSYCHYNLLLRDLDTYLTPVVREHGIGLINASPLHMGVLTAQGAPPWHPAPESVKQTGKSVVNLLERRGVYPATAALRFSLDHPYVSSTLVGMLSTLEVETNLKALDFEMPPDLLQEIDEMVAPVKHVTWPSGRPENSDA
jgi:L-galactose dehydrogenase